MDNYDGIFTDGAITKMVLKIGAGPNITKHEVYTLPGTIPCRGCVNGTVTGLAQNPISTDPVNATFYPNPVTENLKLSYKLPKDCKLAQIKIHDLQGKLVEDFKVTDAFDVIYLPSNYNNGLYLYSLIVDGKIIKTEKVLLNK
jgi:hypothetical protein